MTRIHESDDSVVGWFEIFRDTKNPRIAIRGLCVRN
jgi:hypothetical protein